MVWPSYFLSIFIVCQRRLTWNPLFSEKPQTHYSKFKNKMLPQVIKISVDVVVLFLCFLNRFFILSVHWFSMSRHVNLNVVPLWEMPRFDLIWFHPLNLIHTSLFVVYGNRSKLKSNHGYSTFTTRAAILWRRKSWAEQSNLQSASLVRFVYEQVWLIPPCKHISTSFIFGWIFLCDHLGHSW